MKIPPQKVEFSESDIELFQKDVENILKSGYLSLGSYTKKFESAFANIVNTKYAICVGTGTEALQIILKSLKSAKQTVLLPSNTNYATYYAAINCGINVTLLDGGLFPSYETIIKGVTNDTRAIIIVHIGGFIPDYIARLREFCDLHEIYLIEDAAHAHGSSIFNRMAGSWGHAAAFSFFPTKVITSGEGGIITTNDKDIAELTKCYRNQGKNSVTNRHEYLGSSWRMDELSAALGLNQLNRLSEYVSARNKVMQGYNEKLSMISGLVKIVNQDGHLGCSSGYKYIIQFNTQEERDSVERILKEKYEIVCSGGVYYEPIHKLPVFENQFRNDTFVESDYFCNTHLCLPIWHSMKQEETDYIANALLESISLVKERGSLA